MKIAVKTILTIVALIIAIFLIGTLNSVTGSDSPGVLGLVIGAGLIGGLVAIWRYKPKEQESDNDQYKLDKE